MKILYVSNTGRVDRPYLDPSVRYRCYNNAEELVRLGFLVDVVSFQKFTLKMTENYDLYIFHRPPYNEKLFSALEILEKRNVSFFADYDDLIFNDKYALVSPIYKQGRVEKDECINIFTRNYKSLLLFNNVLTSTEFLATKVRESNPNASTYVLPNGLSTNVLTQIKLNHHKYLKPKQVRKTISYLSGTASHNKDFAEIESALAELTNKYSDKVNLIIVGPLDFDKSKFKQVKHKKYVEYERLFEFISKTDINIAPLEINDFTNCKSGLKFFESAILKVPSIVSPIADMLRFEDSKGISYATTPSEWFSKLEEIILDDELYQLKAENSFKYAIENCTVKKEIKPFLKYIEEL